MIATSACFQSAQSSISDLVQAAQQGDQRAFGALHDTHRNMVQATVAGVLRNRDDADDVVQEVFVQAMHRISELNSPARFSGWIKTIARHKALDFLKAKSRRKELANADCFFVTPDREPSPLDAVIGQEERERLHQAIETLSKTDRDTVKSIYFQGRSLRDLSEKTALPIGTLKRRAHTARQRLRLLLVDLSMREVGRCKKTSR